MVLVVCNDYDALASTAAKLSPIPLPSLSWSNSSDSSNSACIAQIRMTSSLQQKASTYADSSVACMSKVAMPLIMIVARTHHAIRTLIYTFPLYPSDASDQKQGDELVVLG